MRRCDNCKTEILFDEVQFCEHCGATLAPAARPAADDDDDFVVTESAAERAELGTVPKLRPRATDDLGLQSSAEVIQDLNRPEDTPGPSPANTPMTKSGISSLPAGTVSSSGDPLPNTTADGIKRLSPDQVKSIEKNLYAKSDYLSEDEKRNLLKTVHAAERSSPPPVNVARPTKTSAPPIDHQQGAMAMGSAPAKRGRGIAYYMKNYIQVRGDIELRDNDEIQVNNHSFLLRRKRFSPKLILALAGSGFALCLIVIGSLILSNPDGGNGQIVGFALDTNRRPYLLGATIHLPEIGKTYTSNGQGFFRTDRIAPGSYRVEYVLGGQTVGTDYATVASGEITTLSLEPSDAMLAQVPQNTLAQDQAPSGQKNNQVSDSRGTEVERSTETPRSVAAKKPELSRITVAANVENARFTLDGNVLGAGNTTFNAIKPGQHSYVVSKDGFVPVGGSIDLGAGETQVIEVALTPSSNEPEPPNRRAAAQTALKAGDYTQAVELLSQQINQSPGQPDLYVTRAEAYTGLGNKQASCEDYCKAAELYHGKNDSQAMTCYNSAIKQTPKSIAALLARGNLYLNRGEAIAAIADFESVVNLDKRNAIAFLGLGEARYSQGNYNQAIKYFKEARSLSPDDPYVHQYLMLAYLGDDDLKNVKKSYEKFMELSDQAQKDQLKSDRRFNAVLRVVASEQ